MGLTQLLDRIKTRSTAAKAKAEYTADDQARTLLGQLLDLADEKDAAKADAIVDELADLGIDADAVESNLRLLERRRDQAKRFSAGKGKRAKSDKLFAELDVADKAEAERRKQELERLRGLADEADRLAKLATSAAIARDDLAATACQPPAAAEAWQVVSDLRDERAEIASKLDPNGQRLGETGRRLSPSLETSPVAYRIQLNRDLVRLDRNGESTAGVEKQLAACDKVEERIGKELATLDAKIAKAETAAKKASEPGLDPGRFRLIRNADSPATAA